ncbi:hypothetical protein GCM10027047_16430 [Rhodococcus aerolatus]
MDFHPVVSGPGESVSRAASAMLLSGAALIAVSLAVPDYIRPGWVAGFVLSGLASLVAGLVVLRARRLGGTPLVVLLVLADVAIVVSGFASVDRSGTTAGALLSLPTLFAATFLPGRWLLAQLGAAAVSAWVVTSLADGGAAVQLVRTAVLLVACSCPALIVVLLRRRLTTATQTDPLTGLLNRRGLDARLPEVVGRARRTGTAVAVLLADVDHFKRVNDERGHLVGDTVLQVVAGAVRGCVGEDDLVVRLGGEEIAVVVVAAADEAARLGEQLRRQVELAGEQWQVTVSVGGAWATPGEAPGAWLEGLVRCADRHLYEAKQTGRNRTVVAAAS